MILFHNFLHLCWIAALQCSRAVTRSWRCTHTAKRRTQWHNWTKKLEWYFRSVGLQRGVGRRLKRERNAGALIWCIEEVVVGKKTRGQIKLISRRARVSTLQNVHTAVRERTWLHPNLFLQMFCCLSHFALCSWKGKFARENLLTQCAKSSTGFITRSLTATRSFFIFKDTLEYKCYDFVYMNIMNIIISTHSLWYCVLVPHFRSVLHVITSSEHVLLTLSYNWWVWFRCGLLSLWFFPQPTQKLCLK